MPELRAVFWDVDGTLADTEMDGHRPAFNMAFRELGLPFKWDHKLYQSLLKISGGKKRIVYYANELNFCLTDKILKEIVCLKKKYYLQLISEGCIVWRPGQTKYASQRMRITAFTHLLLRIAFNML